MASVQRQYSVSTVSVRCQYSVRVVCRGRLAHEQFERTEAFSDKNGADITSDTSPVTGGGASSVSSSDELDTSGTCATPGM
jgi:hypothetical protein